MLKTIVSQVLHQLKISWWERGENTKFLIIILLIFLGFKTKRKNILNTFFNLWDLLAFGNQLKKAIFFHPKMARMILDPKHKGNRAWEYGMLLSHVPLKSGMHILDVGSGGSALPFYLKQKGLDVIAFDLETPLEKPNPDLLSSYNNVFYNRLRLHRDASRNALRYKHGSVLKLPFKDNQFDLVLCLSTIEHLDYIPSKNKVLPYHLFLKHTQKALSEMVRVLKVKGHLFLTSEVYLPELQTSDRYSHSFLYPQRIGAAYKKEDFDKIFIQTLMKVRCTFIGKTDFDFDNLVNDINRCNYRGRYFTTFAVYAQKTQRWT